MPGLKTPLDSRLQEVVASIVPICGSDLTDKACLAFELDENAGKGSDGSTDFIYDLTMSAPRHCAGAKAKRGEDLWLAAQFNFSADPALKSSLELYLSPNYRDYQPKERGWNQVCLVIEDSGNKEGARPLRAKLAINTEVGAQFAPVIEAMSQKGEIAGFKPKIAEALIIAAFHANGISYNPARAKDPHFAHLVESAANWFVLLAIREKDVLSLESSRVFYLCSNKEDYQNKELHKTQVVII